MNELAAAWEALRETRPNLRIRDAAAELGVPEAALLMTGETVRLDGDMASLLHALPAVGRCMALTRNESAVCEVKGTYGGIDLGPHAGQVVGDAIDLRVFLSQWKYAFAVAEPRRSIHVFDASGTAVHKVYLQPEGDEAAWDAIVASRSTPDAPPPAFEPAPAPRPTKIDAEIDRGALVAGWDAMQDTHEFFHLLAKHGASRTQALRLASEDRARPVVRGSLAAVLEASAANAERIMIFVGNRGCIEIFSGAVARVVRHGPWLNVMDPDFNLHVREDRIASSWVVAKPTRTGIVSSLELYDEAGETIALVFRKRDDRERAEDPAWRQVLDALPSVSS